MILFVLLTGSYRMHCTVRYKAVYKMKLMVTWGILDILMGAPLSVRSLFNPLTLDISSSDCLTNFLFLASHLSNLLFLFKSSALSGWRSRNAFSNLETPRKEGRNIVSSEKRNSTSTALRTLKRTMKIQ